MLVNNLLKVYLFTRYKVAPPGFEPATCRSTNRHAHHPATTPRVHCAMQPALIQFHYIYVYCLRRILSSQQNIFLGMTDSVHK